jgi:hypothetical protein
LRSTCGEEAHVVVRERVLAVESECEHAERALFSDQRQGGKRRTLLGRHLEVGITSVAFGGGTDEHGHPLTNHLCGGQVRVEGD